MRRLFSHHEDRERRRALARWRPASAVAAFGSALMLSACATGGATPREAPVENDGLVTVAEWNICAGEGVCPFRLNGRPDAPATEVSWDDARIYLAWLSVRTGRSHDLPTLAQWRPRGGDIAEWLSDCHDDGLSRCSHRTVRPVSDGEPEALSPDLRLSDVGFRAVEN